MAPTTRATPLTARRGLFPLAAVAATALLLPLAATHPVSYPASSPSPHTSPAPTLYYALLQTAEVVPDALGQALVSISDSLFVPVAGYACQDLDADGVCGNVGELSVQFCASVVLTSIPFGGDWEPGADLYVYQDNTLAICGSLGFWFGGVVTH